MCETFHTHTTLILLNTKSIPYRQLQVGCHLRPFSNVFIVDQVICWVELKVCRLNRQAYLTVDQA